MIKPQEYADRRQQLAQHLPNAAVVIIAATNDVIRNGDSHYRFRQNSNFYYLTGCNESQCILVMKKSQSHCESILFNRPHDVVKEQWIGKFLGQDGGCELLGMDVSLPIIEFSQHLPELLKNIDAIYFSRDNLQQYALQIAALKSKENCYDLEPLLSAMRLYKSPQEIKCIQYAADVSVLAHKRAMRQCRHVQWEYELVAELMYEFHLHGCQDVAYSPIVGAGANACVLHYTANNQPVKSGDLVLIDAAAEYENYSADITRTFPINGRFTTEQRLLYELVLTAQQSGIACIKPGVIWDTIQKIIIRILTDGLLTLGLLSGELEQLITAQAYKKFYMHNSGHWLGLDVHDAGAYKIGEFYRPLEAGMVLTVEPGLYINAHTPNVDPRWWNIGIRIEDDILVTSDGYQNLTRALPTAIADIEALMHA